MAQLYKADGTVVKGIEPENGQHFSLKELRGFVGGLIELAEMGKIVMVLNEEGKRMGLPFNEKATELYRQYFHYNDFIVGDVLICDKEQIN